MSTLLMQLGRPGSAVRVTARPSEFPDHFDVTVDAEAFPFSGSLTQPLNSRDLLNWAADMRQLATQPVDDLDDEPVVLGGNRSMQLKLTVNTQLPVQDPPCYAVQAWLAWTEDDPFPNLTWLIFDVGPVWDDIAKGVEAFLNR